MIGSLAGDRARACLGLALVLLALTGASAQAAPTVAAGVTAAVVPSTVRLGHQGEIGHAHLVVTNGGAKVQRVWVTPLHQGAAGLAITVRRRPRPVNAKSIAVFTVDVRALRAPVGSTTVSLLVRYKPAADSTHAIETTLEVGPPPAIDAAKIASMTLESSLTSLSSGRSAPVYLVIANKTATKLHVGRVVSTVPPFLHAVAPDTELDVPAHQSDRIEVTVKAGDQVRPGRHRMLFEVPVWVGTGGRPITLTAARTTTVEVEGESAVLTAIGVPALFLVPGFLVIAVASLLWALGLFRLRTDSPTFILAPKSSAFWLVSITMSLLLLLLWHALSIDLFDQYGRDDVVEVWALSIAVGLVAYLPIAGLRAWYLHRREFTEDDGPIQVLKRLGRRGIAPTLQTYKPAGFSNDLYLLEPWATDAAKLWLAPAIQLDTTNAPAGFDEELERHMSTAPDAGKVASLISRLPDGAVAWAGGGGPVLVLASELGARGDRARLVRS